MDVIECVFKLRPWMQLLQLLHMSLSLPVLFQRVSSFYESMPVSPMSLVVLAAVVAAPGRRPVDHLKDSLPGFAKEDLSVYLKRLEAAGLVTKEANPADKRSVLHFPTDAGQNLVRDAQLMLQGVALGLASVEPLRPS